MSARDITVVVTSCARHDLLARTLQSFVTFNSDPGSIARIVVVEDGPGNPGDICARFGADLIRTGARVGQIEAIDRAYATVDTPYIFHLEDDWEFYRAGFMERSRRILETDPSTLVVWLRGWYDTNWHPLSFRAPDGSFGVLALDYLGVWSGFTFNPGLRRLSEYRRLGPYGRQKIVTPYARSIAATGGKYEVEASMFYRKLGYRAVILDQTGYVRHTGAGRHVSHSADAPEPAQPSSPPLPPAASVSRNALCPCGSGIKFKHCHGAIQV